MAEASKKKAKKVDPSVHGFIDRSCRLCRNFPQYIEVINKMMDSGASYREIIRVMKEEYGISIALADLSQHNGHRDGVTIELDTSVDEELLDKLSEIEILRRTHKNHIVLSEKVKKLLTEIIDRGLWNKMRATTMNWLVELYKVSSMEVRMLIAEEHREKGDERDELLAGLVNAIETMKGEKIIEEAIEREGSIESDSENDG